MFGLQFVHYSTRILHSKDLDDMQSAILGDDDFSTEGETGGSCPCTAVETAPFISGLREMRKIGPQLSSR